MTKTCCGCLLQDLVRILALVDIVIATVATVFLIASLTLVNNIDAIYIVSVIFFIVTFILEIYLFSLLRSGAIDKIYFKCKRWFIIRTVLLALLILIVIYKLAVKEYKTVEVSTTLRIIWNIFELIVVKRFMDEIGGVGAEHNEESLPPRPPPPLGNPFETPRNPFETPSNPFESTEH